jgi:hypothetical protein
VQERLGLSESGHLPLLFPLRSLGAYLQARHATTDGTEGVGRLLDFVQAYLQGEHITLLEQNLEAALCCASMVWTKWAM